MTLIRLDGYRSTVTPKPPRDGQPKGELVPFGETDMDVVQNIVDAFRAIGEAHLLDPFNGGEDPSDRDTPLRKGM